MLWEDNYLAHYGIKGQSWGLRRFQNEDGTLTEEGKQRYGVGDLEIGKKPSEISDKALAARQQRVEEIQNKMRKQSAIQAALGVSAFAVGTYMKSHGNRYVGNFIQKFGGGYLVGTGVGHAVSTGAYYLAKNVLKKEADSRKKNA